LISYEIIYTNSNYNLMEKIITKLAVIFILVCASSTGLLAQTFCLQMTEVSNNGTDLIVLVEMQADAAFDLADANLQFTYDDASLGTPLFASSPLAPPVYIIPTVTTPAPGIASINIVLPFPGTGSTIAVSPGWTEIVQITFPIINGAAIGAFSWEYNGGTTQTVAFGDDATTPFQIFATSGGCLTGYSPAPVAAAPLCPTLNTPPDLAIDVPSLSGVQFDWTNSPTGTPATAINFLIGTDPLALADIGDIGVVESVNILSTAFTTTYFYTVVPSNSSGVAIGCDVFSFTTQDPPPGGLNFSCATATPIGDGVFTDLGPIAAEGASNTCFNFSTNASWYEYTAPASGECTVSSSIDLDEPDTRVSVHSACDTLDCLASDDDSGTGFTSTVTFDVVAGENYFIEWDDRWSSGEFDFEVSCIPDVFGCTDPTACNFNPLANIEDGLCTFCDDADPCTDDTCVLGVCVNTPIACDDADACTADSCDPLIGCVNTPIDCDDADVCTTDSCDPSIGCLNIPIDCDDGDLCTTDTCELGVCINTAIDCDDADACTIDTCDPLTGCKYTAVDCDDGDACTMDTCDHTTGCVNTPLACNDGDPCTSDSCNSSTGCINTPMDCDDGDACTTDSCTLGVCANTPTDCDDNDACTTDSCDPATGCVNTPIDCDDADACTTDSCDPVTGCVNTDIDCDDANACTTDSCDPANGCVNTAIVCDDADACTADSCDPLTGCVNTVIDCDDGDACTTDSCDPATGCVNTAIVCDDADACTSDSCDPLTGCVNTAIDCDDADACTADSCDPLTGCVNTPLDCDDADACTTDSCDPVTGCVNTAIDCDDADACTADSCDPLTGCVNTAIDCDDANACTTDSCDPAAGCVNTAIDCDDADACTTDSCDPAAGCVNTPIDCDDADACTTDSCDLGVCVNTPVDCDDNDACTTDSCDPATGCVNTPINCDDGDPTTTDSCDPVMGCMNIPGTPCPTDFNADGITDGTDFSIFLGNFGLFCTGCQTDLNNDGVTDGTDFSIFLGNFGLNCI
jgi:hypothetical protein